MVEENGANVETTYYTCQQSSIPLWRNASETDRYKKAPSDGGDDVSLGHLPIPKTTEIQNTLFSAPFTPPLRPKQPWPVLTR